jgi:hypothetical protein
LILGGVGFFDTLTNDSVAGVYVAFLSALALWGWIELAFLTGVITGPVNQPLPDAAPEWERFIRAWGTIAYHEMLLAFTLIAMIFASYGAENKFGLWTFVVLFAARISAKLNLYLGVRKINVEFIPPASQSPAQPFPHCADELAVPDLDHRPQRRRSLLARPRLRRRHAGPCRGLCTSGRADRARPAGALVHGAPAPGRKTVALDAARNVQRQPKPSRQARKPDEL